MTLNAEQRKLNRLRLKQHTHEDYMLDIRLGTMPWLFDFEVHRGVFRPEVSSGIEFAKYLAEKPDLYMGKNVLDMCCGTGIDGIVMGKRGSGRAKQIAFSDISEEAVKNAFANSMRHGLLERARFYQGDLFEGIPIDENYDLIVCNHPFLAGKPNRNVSVSRSWLDDGELIHRFLNYAKTVLSGQGMIVMPFSDIAGTVNHPGIQGERHGYKVWKSESLPIQFDEGFGSKFSVYHLIR